MLVEQLDAFPVQGRLPSPASGEPVSWMMEYWRGCFSQAGSVLNWLVAGRYEGMRGKRGMDGTDPAMSVSVSRPYGCPPSPDSL